MSATSEASALGSFFALGKQSIKGTAATTLYKTYATVSGLAPIFSDREAPVEHPSASGSALNTRRKSPTRHPNYLAGAKATFLLRPKFIVPALMAAGFEVQTADNTTHYTHTLTLATGSAHHWMTSAWNVDETDGAFVTRGVDMRATSFAMSASPEQIEANMTLRGLTIEPMSGSPTYVLEANDEIVPWLGARTTLTMNGYSVVERVRGVEFSIENTMRESDGAIWEAALTGLPQQSIDISLGLTGVNISDDIVEALWYGGVGNSTVDTAAVTGAVNIKWESEDDISGASVPYSIAISIPSVEWLGDPESFEANGDDFIAPTLTAYMLDNVDAQEPITITVINDVASY